jgi:hypothetical protein
MYIYIFEDGTTQKHPLPPTRIDRDMIADGTMMVLRCDSDVTEINKHGKPVDLIECACGTGSDDRFHWPVTGVNK